MATFTKIDQAGAAASTPTYVQRFDAVLDSSYPTGGETVGLQALVGHQKTILGVICIGKVTSTGAADVRHYQYNRATDKLMSFTEAWVETTNATDLSTITVEMIVISY